MIEGVIADAMSFLLDKVKGIGMFSDIVAYHKKGSFDLIFI